MTSGPPPVDLTKSFPRSPVDALSGLVWLPRLVDKARAKLGGTLGEYTYNCPMDVRFFEFTGITPEAFLEAVRRDPADSAVGQWVLEAMQPRTSAEKDAFNRTLASLGPADPGPSGPTTWFRNIDAEEGRL